MSGYSTAQIALVVVGIILWAYGVRTDDTIFRWAGIALFAVAVVLRFVRRFRHSRQ